MINSTGNSGPYENAINSVSANCSCGCGNGHACLCGLIIDIIPYVILVVDKAGVVTFANPLVSNQMGMEKTSIVGKRIFDILTLFQGEKPNGEIEQALAEAGYWKGDIVISSGEGVQRILHFDVKRQPLGQSGDDYNDIYIGAEITESIRGSRQICQEARSSTRAELAGEISHELNNFLSIAMGNLELLGMALNKGKFDNLGNRLKSTREGLNRMAKFVEGLMSVARQEQRLEKIDLNKLVQNEILFLQQEPDFNGIEIITQLDNTIPPIEIDKGRLQQAITNIMSNARDAVAQRAEKRITVTTSLSDPDSYVRLAISDNGPGISEDDYPKIYRQNFTTKGPGHGFGLLSVKGLIKSQGGRVAVGPGPDGGACFTLELPGKRDIAAVKVASMPVLS